MQKGKKRPTIKELQTYLEYKDDELFWKKSPCAWIKPGRIAGSITTGGYYELQICGVRLKKHTAIFAVCHGRYPTVILDHIDRNPGNNKIENLREADYSKNGANQAKTLKKRSSLFKGVHFEKFTNLWRASIQINGENKRIGRFKTEAEAATAYNESAEKYFKNFALLNMVKA